MTELLKTAAPKILEEIQKAHSILLHCHPSPDPDSVCSSLAMKLALESQGKKVTLIAGDSKIPAAFMHFPGAQEIVAKNFFEIDLKEFDLFIIEDSGSPEMISRKAPMVFPLDIMTIVIDHHKSNTGYARINLIDPFYPAVCEMLFDLFLIWNITITHDIALNLFIGMYTDTGGFRYENTKSETLETASKLARLAPDFTKALFIMENSRTIGSLKFEGLTLSSIEAFDDVAFASVSYDDIVKNGITDEDMGVHVADKLKSVIGWNIGCSLIEAKPGIIKISFRTRDSEKYDVSKIAVALGGGGHKAAAGATLMMSLPEAKKKILEVIKAQ